MPRNSLRHCLSKMKRYTVVLATRNKGKLAELERLLQAELGDVIELRSLDEVGITEEIEETGTTFAENALQKAVFVAARGHIALADDSGLCVDALQGAPGVYSARYAGTHGNDAANTAKLLQELAGAADRSAGFVCAFACVFPDGGEPLIAKGEARGEILTAPRGEGGFGYDPVFYYPPLKKTFAELGKEEKNSVSHRGAAVRDFARLFAARTGCKE